MILCNNDYIWFFVLSCVVGSCLLVGSCSIAVFAIYQMYFRVYQNSREQAQLRRLDWKVKAITIAITILFCLEIIAVITNVILQQICVTSLNESKESLNKIIRFVSALHFMALCLIFTQFAMRFVAILNGTLFGISNTIRISFNILSMCF